MASYSFSPALKAALRPCYYGRGIILNPLLQGAFMSRHLDEAEGLCATPDSETQQYFLNQTMLRIKEPKRSLDFYTRVLGTRLVRRLAFPELQFSWSFVC